MRLKSVFWILLVVTRFQVYADDPVILQNNLYQALMTIRADHVFSNTATKDHFVLIVSGKSVVDSKVRLSILTHDNRQIFTDSFKASDLLYNYDNGEGLNIKQKDAIIRKRITHFFSDSCFIYPAIKIAEPFFEDNSDKAAWLDIKSNKDAIGFVYSYGYEGTYAIAYSNKKKKAILYYSSD